MNKNAKIKLDPTPPSTYFHKKAKIVSKKVQHGKQKSPRSNHVESSPGVITRYEAPPRILYCPLLLPLGRQRLVTAEIAGGKFFEAPDLFGEALKIPWFFVAVNSLGCKNGSLRDNDNMESVMVKNGWVVPS